MASPIISIEHFTVTLADGVASTTVAIAAGDVLDCTPFISHRAENGDSGNASLFVRPRYLTGPNRLEVGRIGTSGALTIKITNIEWDTTQVTIQTGSFSEAGNGENVPISAVVIAKSWCTYGWDLEGGDLDNGAVMGIIDSTTNLRFERDIAQGNTYVLNWWIVEDTSAGGLWDVQSIAGLAITGTTADSTITSVAEDRTMLIGGHQITGGVASADASGSCFLFDDVTVRYDRDDAVGTNTLQAFVITFTVDSAVEVQRGSITNGSGTEVGTSSITAVSDINRALANTPMRSFGTISDEDTEQNPAYASLELNSSTEVEANNADSASTEVVHFEIVDFVDAANQSPVFVGANH